ncbi:hypothetical protein HS125_02940 [bacterium]|nr:hypothetical protein [bacterium]
MNTLVRFRCPNCDAGLSAKADRVGRSYGCPNCSIPVTVPSTQALVPVKRQVIIPEIVEDDEHPRVPARRRKRRMVDDSKPVKMRLGNLAEMNVEVDKPTRNAMATTWLGGLLVALGAIVFCMFGGKSKSA